MEDLLYRKRNFIIAASLTAAALTGCSIDSYLTDPSNVQCDGRRTISDLQGDGMATFIVHGKSENDVATVKVRRSRDLASVAVSGEVTGPPQELGADGFTYPTPVVNGAELSTFGAGGVWIIDVRKDTVVIQGSCEGM